MRAFAFAVLAFVGAIAPQLATAQPYPSKPIRIIVPLSAGGTTDVFTREVGQKLSEALGQSVIIDNRAGGNGVIGANALAKAPPDGYTLAMLISSHAINPHVVKNLPYDTVADFTPIALVATMPGMLAVHPSVPVNDVRGLIALAKAQPGKLTYAQPGGLSSGHIAMELLKNMAGVDILGVPYKGGGNALVDVAGGQVQMTIITPVSVLPFVNSGRLKALATTGAKRPPGLSKLPTIAESGLPEFELNEWFGLFAPANTPQPIVERIHAEISKIMASKAMTERLNELGAEAHPSTSAQFSKFVADDVKRRGELAKLLQLKLD